MPMERCVNHPDRWANYTVIVDGKKVPVCTYCRTGGYDETEEEEDD